MYFTEKRRKTKPNFTPARGKHDKIRPIFTQKDTRDTRP